jgi:hypothetical protein
VAAIATTVSWAGASPAHAASGRHNAVATSRIRSTNACSHNWCTPPATTSEVIDPARHRVGLDHLSFNVASRSELDAWQDRVAERAIEHTPIAESAMWDVLVVRDPDNIQLEFFYMKPEAATLLG